MNNNDNNSSNNGNKDNYNEKYNKTCDLIIIIIKRKIKREYILLRPSVNQITIIQSVIHLGVD